MHKLTSTASVALYAPSSALLMAKAVQCVHARGVCALQCSSFTSDHYIVGITS